MNPIDARLGTFLKVRAIVVALDDKPWRDLESGWGIFDLNVISLKTGSHVKTP